MKTKLNQNTLVVLFWHGGEFIAKPLAEAVTLAKKQKKNCQVEITVDEKGENYSFKSATSEVKGKIGKLEKYSVANGTHISEYVLMGVYDQTNLEHINAMIGQVAYAQMIAYI